LSDEKREQSIKVMGEANLRRERTNQALTDIQNRLAQLEEETAELHEFESFDSRWKALELLLDEHDRAKVAHDIARSESSFGRARLCSFHGGI
jgi:structural maintenance of chromosome 3 (chondroitin sulfate proteoglycan 6)